MAVEQTTIARSMIDYLNEWSNKPARFTLEGIAKEAPSATILQLPTSGVVKKYIDGSYIGMYNFAVYIRLNKADTSQKLEVLDLYDDLMEYFKSDAKPDLGEGATTRYFELLSTPALAVRYDDGSEDYQASYRLVYKAKGLL